MTSFNLLRFCGVVLEIDRKHSILVSGDSEDDISLKPVGQKTNGTQSTPGHELGGTYGYLQGPKVAV